MLFITFFLRVGWGEGGGGGGKDVTKRGFSMISLPSFLPFFCAVFHSGREGRGCGWGWGGDFFSPWIFSSGMEAGRGK